MVVGVSTGLAGDAPKEFAPRGSILDLKRQPIHGARITLHRWDGAMSPALQTATSDSSGHFEFPSRRDDAYYYAVIRQAPYAPVELIVTPEGPIEATLRKAVQGAWIDVRSAGGEPLEGARIASISVRTPENPQTYLSRGTEHLLGFEFASSDDRGRLNLPPLPEGAFVDIRVDHPRWAQAKLTNATVTEGRLDTVNLSAGVMTTFEFVADSRTPLTLDGLACEASLLAGSSNSAESISRITVPITDSQIMLCAHPVAYWRCNFTAPGLAITPQLDRLTIERGEKPKVRFLVRKTVNASGRVLHRDGTPHPGAEVVGWTENLSPDGTVPGASAWAYCGRAETDVEGKFSVALAPGRSRVEFVAQGFVPDRDDTVLDARAEGPNEIPDFVTDALEPIRGRVVDAGNQPVAGAIVRPRHPLFLGRQPQVSDTDGKYEIPLPWIPVDMDTERRRYEFDVAAYVADEPLMGVARVDLRRSDSLREVNIMLGPDPSADALLNMEDNQWALVQKRKTAQQRAAEAKPAGRPGEPAPELDGVAWFNTDARSLKDFRGRYVLLDFWFTGCGPCHYDFPSVKLVHERFEKHGVTVIGVHDDSSTPEAVREHCRQQGLAFPIVVDHTDGRILNAYRPLGINSFPSYVLVGPNGNILQNDKTSEDPSLRTFKLEVIRRHLLHLKTSTGITD